MATIKYYINDPRNLYSTNKTAADKLIADSSATATRKASWKATPTATVAAAPIDTASSVDPIDYYRTQSSKNQETYDTQKGMLEQYYGDYAKSLSGLNATEKQNAQRQNLVQQNTLNNYYNLALDELNASRKASQEQAYIAYARANKYMPNLLKQQGLNGLGLSETAQTGMLNNYMSSLGKIQQGYDTNKTSLSSEYAGKLNDAQAAYLQAIAESDSKYATNKMAMDQNQHGELFDLYANYAQNQANNDQAAYAEKQKVGDAYYAELMDILENGGSIGSGDDFTDGTGSGGTGSGATADEIYGYYLKFKPYA